MSKVLSIHTYEPRPGANLEDYEQLMLDTARYLQNFAAEGWRSYMFKGDRGANKGKYSLIHEFDSLEARNRYWPVEDGGPTEETQRVFFDDYGSEMVDRWYALVGDSIYTDFVVMDG